MEFSQKLVVFLIFFGVAGVIASYALGFMGFETNESVTITLITEIIVTGIAYMTYQFGLKSNRNKHKVDANGNPFLIKVKGESGYVDSSNEWNNWSSEEPNRGEGERG